MFLPLSFFVLEIYKALITQNVNECSVKGLGYFYVFCNNREEVNLNNSYERRVYRANIEMMENLSHISLSRQYTT